MEHFLPEGLDHQNPIYLNRRARLFQSIQEELSIADPSLLQSIILFHELSERVGGGQVYSDSGCVVSYQPNLFQFPKLPDPNTVVGFFVEAELQVEPPNTFVSSTLFVCFNSTASAWQVAGQDAFPLSFRLNKGLLITWNPKCYMSFEKQGKTFQLTFKNIRTITR